MRRKLVVSAAAFLVLSGIGTIIALAQRLPYDHPLWGVGDPDQVLRDWLVGSGTALSPPALMMVALSVGLFLLYRSGRAYAVGVWVVTVLGFVSVIGVLGERITWEVVTQETFDLLKAMQAWGALVAGMFMWGFGLAAILNLRRAKDKQEIP